MLGKDHRSIGHDVEDTVAALDELWLITAERVRDLSRQTGGSREILSPTAIGNGDLHDGCNPTVQ
jgi:hypothetical protein